mmetsp:Transcript_7083/g.11120  ORF Transcript_7083/g.11120 Transcript_7083/m.11120 type:complete len:97 (+) Transcript_7083:387-677(+)
MLQRDNTDATTTATITKMLGLYLLANISVDHFSEKRNATFYNVATKAFSQGALVIDVAVAVKCFGVGTSYLIVVGDLLPKAFSSMGACNMCSQSNY